MLGFSGRNRDSDGDLAHAENPAMKISFVEELETRATDVSESGCPEEQWTAIKKQEKVAHLAKSFDC